MNNDALTQLGEALGLHPDFIADVARRGVAATFDRAQMTDPSGAQMRILAMTQELAEFIQEQAARGRQMKPGILIDMVDMISQRHGVPPEAGEYLLGAVFEVFQQTAGQLAQQGRSGGNENSRPDGNVRAGTRDHGTPVRR